MRRADVAQVKPALIVRRPAEFRNAAITAVLLVVGVKMLAHEPIKEALGENFNLYLLGVVLTILGIGVVASLLHRTGNATSQTSSAGAADLKSTK